MREENFKILSGPSPTVLKKKKKESTPGEGTSDQPNPKAEILELSSCPQVVHRVNTL